jgi:hypothetical protein
VQDSFGPGAKGLVKDVACVLIVHRIEIAANSCPQVRVGLEMINLPTATNGIPDFLLAANISTHELNRVQG